jgi:hypothetical protein
MFGQETLTAELDKTGPIGPNSPAVYALVRLAALLGKDAEFAEALAQLDAAGVDFAREAEPSATHAFHRKGGASLSVAEMASKMSPEQWARWMGEAPDIAKMISRPNAQGMEGFLLRAVIEAAKATGMKQAAAKAMVLNANLTWTDDPTGPATHTTTVNGGARHRRRPGA